MLLSQNEYGFNGWQAWLAKWFTPLCIAGIIINATGFFVTILDSDGTLYAMVAKTIVKRNDFVNLMVFGKDWLDKPHFPFWLIAISYKIFGINTFAYKLPAFLCWLMGAYYTYKFAFKAYNKSVAQLSVLLYLSAAHLVISNNDVRAEPYLTGFIIGSVYHFYIASLHKKFSLHIVWGALLAAFAVMTKGPFVLITIGAGFIIHWIIQRDFNQLFNYKWIVAFILIAVFSLPEVYTLYVQFDLHPEKEVFGTTGVSGVRFFFWDSQFGRFLNNGPIKGKGDLFFYLHTMLWAFLPWSLVFYMALGWKIFKSGKFYHKQEYITIGSGLTMLLIFSLSKFQLPHYLNILFPFFCIITAQYLYQLQKPAWIRVMTIVQYIIIVALLLLPILLIYFYHTHHSMLAVMYMLVVIVATFLVFKKNDLFSTIGKSFLAALGAYGFLNIFFYTSLIDYQSGSNAAKFSNTLTGNSVKHAAVYGTFSHSFTFYTKKDVVYGNLTQLKVYAKQPLLIYTTQEGLEEIRSNGFEIMDTHTFPYYHASKLTGKFINYKTRPSVVDTHYLITVVAR
ncbi:MAG: glycosyltransferase family 39 protein [Chitinophagaceae bacterium]|nr:glycosyltransferase family 39 protein [Chitinophagaceae bacterium]